MWSDTAYSDDTIASPSLDHLTINARVTHEADDHAEVVLEAIRRYQRRSDDPTPHDVVVENGCGVSIRATAEAAPGPQARRNLDDRKQPRGPTLIADERAELISLKLKDFELPQHLPLEALSLRTETR